MKHKKRTLKLTALLLTAVMLISLVQSVAFAEEPIEADEENIITDTEDISDDPEDEENGEIEIELLGNQHTVTYHANNGTDETVSVTLDEGDDHVVEESSLSYFKCKIDYWNTEADGNGTFYYEGSKIEDISEDIDLYAFWRLPLNELDSFDADGYEWSGNDDSPYIFTMPEDAVLYASITFPLNDSEEENIINVSGDCEINGAYNNYDGYYRAAFTVTGEEGSSLRLGSVPCTGSGDTMTVKTEVTVDGDVFIGASGGQSSKLIINDTAFTINGSLNLIEQLVMENKADLVIENGKLSFSNAADIDFSDESEIYISGLDPDESDIPGNENIFCVLHKEGENIDVLKKLLDDGWISSRYSFDEHSGGHFLFDNDKNIYATGPIVIKKPSEEYTVRFVDHNERLIEEQSVAAGGAAIAPKAPSRNGYTFSGWDRSFDNVTEDITVKALYTRINSGNTRPKGGSGSGAITHIVKFDTNGGSDISNRIVVGSARINIPEEPKKEGFVFAGWYKDAELYDEYDFASIVNKSFTLYAKWEELAEEEPEDAVHDCPSLRFYDLDITQWYHYDTDYVIAKDIFRGVTKEQFAPDANITRAMMITVLYRAEGEPKVVGNATFEDSDKNAYYANAVIWGQQNGIIKGYSDKIFAPEQPIIREQIAAIMHRYAIFKGYDVSVGENTNILSYDDFADVSEYAIPSVQWAVGSGMIKGRTESTLDPRDNAKRVEIAAMLHRFLEANK